MDPKRIESLRNPAVFPENAGEVEILQTHLSVVCLSGEFAYKFKKAIHLPFADFSSLEKRKVVCHDEIRLNRRLCPEIYLDVVPLAVTSEGGLRIGEEGEIVDYAVKMRRLPSERMMDVMLERGEVTEDHVLGIADRMVEFHQRADRGAEIDALGSPAKLRKFALANFEETQGQAGEVFSRSLHEALEKRTRTDFDSSMPILLQRREAGRIVYGHGDLHARNICLTDPVSIYDCIEFEPAFRCEDVATEHAFLLMDLRFRGHPELAAAYLEAVVEKSGDPGIRVLAPMLMRYRAMVRAKVSAITAGEEEISEEQRITSAELARRYLRFAALLAVEEEGPLWFLFCGLPGSGKTTVAESLSAASGWPVLGTDRIRKELAGVAPEERLGERYYSPEFSERTYDELISRARLSTQANAPCVLLDGNFPSLDLRKRACREADSVGARTVILHVRTDEEMATRRLHERMEQEGIVSDADEVVFQKLKQSFEAPQREEADLVLSTSGWETPEDCWEFILLSLLK